MKASLISSLSHAAGNVRRIQPSAFAGEDFVVTECGDAATDKYVRLRYEGQTTQNQAFNRAFGAFFSGESETCLLAAQAFESTKCYARKLKHYK